MDIVQPILGKTLTSHLDIVVDFAIGCLLIRRMPMGIWKDNIEHFLLKRGIDIWKCLKKLHNCINNFLMY